MFIFTREEAEELSSRLNLKLFKTSVKDNVLVDDGKGVYCDVNPLEPWSKMS